MNDVLRTAAAVDPRLVLIDWERMSREIPGVLSDDRLHPTRYGADVLAQAVGITLGKAPGAGPDVTLPAFGSSTRPTLAPGTNTNKGETSNDSSGRTHDPDGHDREAHPFDGGDDGLGGADRRAEHDQAGHRDDQARLDRRPAHDHDHAATTTLSVFRRRPLLRRRPRLRRARRPRRR